MADNEYIWTNHAWKRIKERKIPDHYITATLASPDKITDTQNKGTKLQKRFGQQTVTVITKKNNRGENVMVSFWIDPPMPGTRDARLRKRYIQAKKTTGIKKLWYVMLYILRI